MKVKAINKTTSQQFDCEEIEINGFKYYIIDTAVGCKYGISKLNEIVEVKTGYDATLYKGIVCSNNSDIDIPKVVDEVDILLRKNFDLEIIDSDVDNIFLNGLTEGYNKSKETYPFSDEDMMEFADWVYRSQFDLEGYTQDKETKKLFQIWKEQQPKIIYYQ